MSILTYIAGWPLLAALLLIFVPGNYRVIVQMKHGGVVETGIFEAKVQ